MLLKLFNNAMYGKTMENERKHVKVNFISRQEGRYKAEAYIARPIFQCYDSFNENCAAIKLLKFEVNMKQSIYVGLSVLDLSKSLTFRFYYDFKQKELKDDCNLLYTYTDSTDNL